VVTAKLCRTPRSGPPGRTAGGLLRAGTPAPAGLRGGPMRPLEIGLGTVTRACSVTILLPGLRVVLAARPSWPEALWGKDSLRTASFPLFRSFDQNEKNRRPRWRRPFVTTWGHSGCAWTGPKPHKPHAPFLAGLPVGLSPRPPSFSVRRPAGQPPPPRFSVVPAVGSSVRGRSSRKVPDFAAEHVGRALLVVFFSFPLFRLLPRGGAALTGADVPSRAGDIGENWSCTISGSRSRRLTRPP